MGSCVCVQQSFLVLASVTCVPPSDLTHVTYAELPHAADYTGGCNYDAALRYIVGKFLARLNPPDGGGAGSGSYAARRGAGRPKKDVFWQVTCATDSNNVNTVFHAAKV